MFINPENIHDASDQELSEAYQKIAYLEKEIAPEKQQIREEIMARLGDNDGKVIGIARVSKTARPQYAKLSLEKAKALGATIAKVSVQDAINSNIYFIEEVDAKAVEKLYKSGIKMDIPVTVYPIISFGDDDEAE